MKVVKYKVTGAFGDSDEGDVVDALLLLEEVNGGEALLYHPRSQGNCGSLEMAHPTYDPKAGKEYYKPSGQTDMFGWINIDSQKKMNELIENLQSLSYRSTTRKSLGQERISNG